MSDPPKPKRPHSKSGRPRSRPPPRDPRVEEDVVVMRRSEPHPRPRESKGPRPEALSARIGALEAELARMKEGRGADADELARMLVRIAAAERAKAGAEERAGALSDRVRELDAMREEVRRIAETREQAVRRAELAEQSAADGAAALERTRAELQSDRSRFADLEAKVGRTRREHGEELAALRAGHADASVEAGRALEEERSAAARARQQAAAAEMSLAAARETLARATSLIEEIERREEMAAAMRARSLDQMRRVLAGDASLPTGMESSPDAALPVLPAGLPMLKAPPPPAKWPPEASTADSNAEARTMEKSERDLGE